MSKIKFIRFYNRYGTDQYDVIYKSGRAYLYMDADDLPKTAKAFMEGKAGKVQHDKIYGKEVIYE